MVKIGLLSENWHLRLGVELLFRLRSSATFGCSEHDDRSQFGLLMQEVYKNWTFAKSPIPG